MSKYYTKKWKDEDLDAADGETTIFEKGAVDGKCMYTLLNFNIKIVTISTSLLLKLYTAVYGVAEHMTDEDAEFTATCTEGVYIDVASKYIKITVTPTGDNHSLRTEANYKADNLKAALEA